MKDLSLEKQKCHDVLKRIEETRPRSRKYRGGRLGSERKPEDN